jgi:hypothetical protein
VQFAYVNSRKMRISQYYNVNINFMRNAFKNGLNQKNYALIANLILINLKRIYLIQKNKKNIYRLILEKLYLINKTYKDDLF